MKLKYLGSFNADKYNIKKEELEGLKLDQKVKFICDKMQQVQNENEKAKKECDQKRYQLLAEAQELKKERAKFKAREMEARENRGRLKKQYNDNKDLINKKIRLAKNEK